MANATANSHIHHREGGDAQSDVVHFYPAESWVDSYASERIVHGFGLQPSERCVRDDGPFLGSERIGPNNGNAAASSQGVSSQDMRETWKQQHEAMQKEWRAAFENDLQWLQARRSKEQSEAIASAGFLLETLITISSSTVPTTVPEETLAQFLRIWARLYELWRPLLVGKFRKVRIPPIFTTAVELSHISCEKIVGIFKHLELCGRLNIWQSVKQYQPLAAEIDGQFLRFMILDREAKRFGIDFLLDEERLRYGKDWYLHARQGALNSGEQLQIELSTMLELICVILYQETGGNVDDLYGSKPPLEIRSPLPTTEEIQRAVRQADVRPLGLGLAG